jgi:MbtH protein
MEANEHSEGTHVVVLNDEGQYSLWPGDLAVPAGWRETGMRGSHDECVAYVDREWTDMRPLSLRRAMEGAGEGV